MELQTKILGEGLSCEGKVLLETLARSIRDFVARSFEELSDGNWEEHGMEGELSDQQELVTQEAGDGTNQELEAALQSHGFGDSSLSDSCIVEFAQALFEELCETPEEEVPHLYEDQVAKAVLTSCTRSAAYMR